MLDVVGGSVLEPHDAPKLLARRQLSGGGPHLLLDRILCRVGGLETLIGEELDSVVGDRIVRGGDHRPRPGGPVDGEERNRRCGDDTCERDLHSRRAEAREERTFQHRPAEARVASDHYLAAIRRQHEPGGTAQDEHEVRGEVAVGHAAHTVGTEEPRHGDIFPDRAARDGRGRWRVVDSGYPVTSIHHSARDPLRLSEVKLYAQTPRMRNGQILRDISTLAWGGLWNPPGRTCPAVPPKPAVGSPACRSSETLWKGPSALYRKSDAPCRGPELRNRRRSRSWPVARNFAGAYSDRLCRAQVRSG